LLRERSHLHHYSIRTKTQYDHWTKRFILFHGKRHPAAMGAPEVEAFLTHLAVEGQVAASTLAHANTTSLLGNEPSCPTDPPAVYAKNHGPLDLVGVCDNRISTVDSSGSYNV